MSAIEIVSHLHNTSICVGNNRLILKRINNINHVFYQILVIDHSNAA